MITIPGYELTEILYQSASTLVYRGRREMDTQPLVLKIINELDATGEEIARFHHEYEIAHRLHSLTQCVHVSGLYHIHHYWVMEMDDIGGTSLAQLMRSGAFQRSAKSPNSQSANAAQSGHVYAQSKQGTEVVLDPNLDTASVDCNEEAATQLTSPMDIDTFWTLAIKIIQAVGELHQQQVLHKDINPANLVLNLQSGELQIIDFNISVVVPIDQLHNRAVAQHATNLQGTIHYIAPEQTGRTSNPLDYRSDLYAVGVTFYELLTGKLPFEGDDVLELIHSHIAKEALAPHLIQAEIPAALSQIVLKLLAKSPEERYQTAAGLEADLHKAKEQWQHTGTVTLPVLARNDYTPRRQVSHTLYGRDREFAKLVALFEQVVDGDRRMVFVDGPASSGKSTLVQKIRPMVQSKGGLFITGKFDQLQHSSPYAALTQALNELIDQLLMNDKAVIEQWCTDLHRALGANLPVLVSILPRLALLVGAQPFLPELHTPERQNRIRLAFQRFIRLFARAEHPLVLFLDDLQWVDQATVHILQLWITDHQLKYFFLIGSYRQDEVDAEHSLLLLFNELRTRQIQADAIPLQPLEPNDIYNFVIDALQEGEQRGEEQEICELAEILYRKTAGNPYHLQELFKHFVSERLLYWHHGHRRWQWDQRQIQAYEPADNLVALLTERARQLTTETQDLLKLASCIGNHFTHSILGATSALSPSQLEVHLQEALADGFVVQVTDELLLPAWRLLNTTVAERSSTLSEASTVPGSLPAHREEHHYRFVHDGVQSAFYQMLSGEERLRFHHRIGLALWPAAETNIKDQQIFDATNHLNLAQDLQSEPSPSEALVRLNLLAGDRARSAGATDAALNYLERGIRLLGKSIEAWSRHYQLMLELHTLAATAALISGDLVKMEFYSQEVLTNAVHILDKQQVYQLQMQVLFAQNKPAESVALALRVLAQLDIHFPAEPTELSAREQLYEIQALLGEEPLKQVRALPPMTDPQQLMAMQLLAGMQIAANLANIELFPFIVFEMMRRTLCYGYAPTSAQGYIVYGRILYNLANNLETGYQFGLLAMELAEKHNDKVVSAEIRLLFHSTLSIWKVHMAKSVMHIGQARQIAWEYGNIEIFAHSATFRMIHAMFAGEELNRLKKLLHSEVTELKRFGFDYQISILTVAQDMVEQLTRVTADPLRLTKVSTVRVVNRYQWSHCYYHIQRSAFFLYFEQPSHAFAHIVQAEELDSSPFFSVRTILINFYGSLSYLAVYLDHKVDLRPRLAERIAANQRIMKQWAENAPSNYLHKYLLVEAELARVYGDDKTARCLYDEAIAAAKDAAYIQEEGLIAEYAARFYFSQRVDHLGFHYLQMAYDAYQRWGAPAKTAQLEKKYPQLLNQQPDGRPNPRTLQTTSMHLDGTALLDILSISKAAETILGEIELERLLRKMIKLVIENAGAERGLLILAKAGQWVVEAEISADDPRAKVCHSVPIHHNDAASERGVALVVEAVDYVIHTKELLLIGDVSRDPRFADTPHVRATRPKSLLCLPLLNQNHVSGVLYLENRLSENIFQSQRVEVLKLLSSQMAISLDNALLYNRLREENEERKRIEQELAEHRDHLEELVQQRTSELSNALANLKNTQQHLIEAEKMAALGGLVAGVAHEINTPIGIGVTAASTLTEETQQLLLAVEADQLRRSSLLGFLETAQLSSRLILNNLLRAANLIQSFKQIATDRTTHELRFFPVIEYIHETLRSLEPQLNRTNHIVQVLGDRQVRIQSYPGDFSQVVTNLVMNSLVHAYDADEIGHICFTVTSHDEKVELCYTDDGRGIAAEHLKRIFEPFFTTARHQGGTGLGLHIVYNLVTQKLGGTIRCTSEVGHGVTFQLFLPYQQSADLE